MHEFAESSQSPGLDPAVSMESLGFPADGNSMPILVALPERPWPWPMGRPAFLVRLRIHPLRVRRRGRDPILNSNDLDWRANRWPVDGAPTKSSPRYRNEFPPRISTTASHGLLGWCLPKRTRPTAAPSGRGITTQGPAQDRLNQTNFVSCLPTDGTSPMSMQ